MCETNTADCTKIQAAANTEQSDDPAAWNKKRFTEQTEAGETKKRGENMVNCRAIHTLQLLHMLLLYNHWLYVIDQHNAEHIFNAEEQLCIVYFSLSNKILNSVVWIGGVSLPRLEICS